MIMRGKSALSSVEDEVVIRVENISKKFSKSLKRAMIYGMNDTLRNIFRSSAKPEKLRKKRPVATAISKGMLKSRDRLAR